MSSRNVRLYADQRSDAPRIYQALCRAAMLHDPAQIIAHARREIEASPMAKIDYLTLVDAASLQPVTSLERSAILAAAVFYGDVRLIDHVGIPARPEAK
ncbi:MAG: pantoate--beta-alanine ligase, partial [Luteolibacter sp.]